MDIVIIGAGGSVGRTLAHLVVAERLLDCDQRLVLVGNPEGRSATTVYGLAADLIDAYSETAPRIEVTLDPDAIRGDLIVMAGGMTTSLEQGGVVERYTVAQVNVPIFDRYARALAEHGKGHEIVICVANPNELAVTVFGHHLHRRRVIGMGAFLDSLRFRQEIAHDLGVRRQRIHGFVVGEHGPHMIPLWSSVHVYGYDDAALARALHRIRRGHKTAAFWPDVAERLQKLQPLILEGRITEAYALTDEYPADIRATVKPYVTHFSGAKTVAGTARATMELIRTILSGADALIAGQIGLEGEFHGLHGTLGVPFVVGNQGVEHVVELPLSDAEMALLEQAAESINESAAEWVS
jgi:malate dehydrogenase